MMMMTCVYSEFSLGSISNSSEDGAIPFPDADGLFFTPNPELSEGTEVDEDNVCVFSSAFRKSSAFGRDDEGNLMLKPLPLASSNGCPTTTKNFQLVVMGTVSEEEDDNGSYQQIELEFSDDFGSSYYTDDKECPLSYVARKLNDDELEVAGRSLAVIEEDKSIGHPGHRELAAALGLGVVVVVVVTWVTTCTQVGW